MSGSALQSRILSWARACSSIHRQHLVRHIEGFAVQTGTVSRTLDVGSGSAPYKHMFNTQRYIAIDVSALHKVSAVGDVSALPFQASTMDVIVCTEVIEHVENVDIALGEISRVLKSGGHLILTTPFLMGMHCAVDLRRFTETSLRILLDRHDFDIVRLEKRGGILSVLSATLLQIPLQILGLHENKNHSNSRYLLVGLTYAFLVPLAKSLVLLDGLDKGKNFTLGYDGLCQKRLT